MKTMQKVQRGFTLIELMIVVAIIGILAALAIPAYQDYTIKSRVGESASLSGSFKTALDIYWSENGTFTNVGTGLSPSTLGLSSAKGTYVSDISIEAGPVIEITLATDPKLGNLVASGGASGGCIEYTPGRPSNTGGNLTWSVAGCSSGAVPQKYLPKT